MSKNSTAHDSYKYTKCFTSYIFVLLIMCLPVNQAMAAISITPAYVEAQLDKGKVSGKFMISNTGEEEERYRIKAIHFTFLEKGGLRDIPADENSLADWIRFNPKEFSLAPKTRQAIRYVILPGKKLKQGEYWGAMEMESLNTSVGTGQDASGRTMKLEVIPRILVPIFGSVGEVQYEGSLNNLQITESESGSRLQTDIDNTGQGRLLVTGHYDILDLSGEIVEEGTIGKAYVLPGLKRKFSTLLKTDLSAGNYTVRINYTSPNISEELNGQIAVMPQTASSF